MCQENSNLDMPLFYADLHIHIGCANKDKPVKISASRDMTFQNIAREASLYKGLDMIGIIDCQSPAVQEDIRNCLDSGDMIELSDGGIRYQNTTLILGSEIEVRDADLGPAHLLAYLPNLAAMEQLTAWLRPVMKNVTLSSQRLYASAIELQQVVLSLGGFLIPAHVFTPYRSVYGSCTDRMAHLLDLDGVAAVELGLSADTTMASYISELDPFSFVSNSDAHSLGKIGREYNRIAMKEATFQELALALGRQKGRRIEANFGLQPCLGKYHRSFCTECHHVMDDEGVHVVRCSICGSKKLVKGVLDRLLEIADRSSPQVPDWKAPYYYQVPLEFIPGLGKKTLARLLDQMGTEMYALHKATYDELVHCVGTKLANWILRARHGEIQLDTGGGGTYGKVTKDC